MNITFAKRMLLVGGLFALATIASYQVRAEDMPNDMRNGEGDSEVSILPYYGDRKDQMHTLPYPSEGEMNALPYYDGGSMTNRGFETPPFNPEPDVTILPYPYPSYTNPTPVHASPSDNMHNTVGPDMAPMTGYEKPYYGNK
jgi:hypothetical protein